MKAENNEMIGCDLCKGWFHAACMGLDYKMILKSGPVAFECPACRKKKAQGKAPRSRKPASERV